MAEAKPMYSAEHEARVAAQYCDLTTLEGDTVSFKSLPGIVRIVAVARNGERRIDYLSGAEAVKLMKFLNHWYGNRESTNG